MKDFFYASFFVLIVLFGCNTNSVQSSFNQSELKLNGIPPVEVSSNIPKKHEEVSLWQRFTTQPLGVFIAEGLGLAALGTTVAYVFNFNKTLTSLVNAGIAPIGGANGDLNQLKEFDKGLGDTSWMEPMYPGTALQWPPSPKPTIRKLYGPNWPRESRLDNADYVYLLTSMYQSQEPPYAEGSLQVISEGFSVTKDSTAIAQRKPTQLLKLPEEPNSSLLIAMPFVYPACRFLESHVVLIAFDKRNKKLYYFDPKGEDPRTANCFTDEPGFNMQTELDTLKGQLEAEELIINHTAYQQDPTNCGIYVLLAIQNLLKGNPIDEGFEIGPKWVNTQKVPLANQLWGYVKSKK